MLTMGESGSLGFSATWVVESGHICSHHHQAVNSQITKCERNSDEFFSLQKVWIKTMKSHVIKIMPADRDIDGKKNIYLKISDPS